MSILNKLILIFLLAFSNITQGQDLALFIDASDVLDNSSLKGGPFCGFIDVNGDYRDDIIRFDGSSDLYIDIQSNNGENFYTKNIANIEGGSWAVLAGDLNNDGINEIFTAGSYNGATILSSTNNQSDFAISQKTPPNFFAQNSNFVDIDNDGWLDVFICDDDDLSEIYINDGTGALKNNNSLIDMRTVPASDNSGNYSSVWTDVDDDGDLDLYIGKCRSNVSSSSDPRRINALFINDNGTFREAATEFGIAIGEQSWTSNFGDIDNDGDQDLFMVNHDARSMLFENIDNNEFVEIPLLSSGNEIRTYGYQSAFADFNNDGFLDLLIAGEDDYLLLNNGEKSFELNETPFGITDIASFALGDSNQDGFIDVLAEYNSFFATNSEKTKLFRSIPNGNHFLSIALNGIASNKNGIGAKLMLYGNWGKQTRYIKSGTGYGITNSLTARFGLKTESTIDSLVIQWPSGFNDVYTDLGSDKNYLATEGICIKELVSATADASTIDCQNDDVEITIEDQDNYTLIWSNGEQNSLTNVITEFDHINATFSNIEGCTNHSQYIVIDTLKALIPPTLNIKNDISICASAFPIDLESKDGAQLKWQDGSVDNDFRIESDGQYFAQIFNRCDTVNSAIISVQTINPENVEKDSTIIINEAMSLTLDNNQPNATWYSDEDGTNIIETGNILKTDLIENDTIFFYNFEIDQTPPLYTGGELFNIDRVPSFQFFEDLGGSMTFKVKKASVLNSITIHTTRPGARIIEIISKLNNQLVYQDTFDFEIGPNKIQLNAPLEQGSFDIQTNIDFNFTNFQTNSPLFSIIFESIKYPYRIGDLIDIQSSSFGDVFYAYFFDWEVSPKTDDCISDVFEISIDIDTTNSLIVLEDDEFQIFPNPFGEIININTNHKIEQINIYNTSGQLQFNETIHSNLNFSINPKLSSGAYILELLSDEGVYRKVVIVE